MPTLPDREGRFRAYPAEWGVDQHNGKPVFQCRWRITEWYSDAEKQWYDFTGTNSEITSWSYLFKNDGTPNKTAIDQLVDALGWDGADLVKLNDHDWSQRGCSLWTEYETYKEKTHLRVKWIDGWDATGGVGGGGLSIRKADASTLQQMQASLGGQLRASTPQKGDGSTAKGAPPPPPHPHIPAKPADVDEASIPF